MTPLLDSFRMLALTQDFKHYTEPFFHENGMKVDEVFFRDIALHLQRWSASELIFYYETTDHWYQVSYERAPLYEAGIVMMRRFDIPSNDETSIFSSGRELARLRDKWPLDLVDKKVNLT